MSDEIRKHWPSFLLGIIDFDELAETEEPEINQLQSALNRLLDDQFVLTSSVDGIKRREKMLGIQADSSLETIEFRRQRIINRYQMKPPFSIRFLQQQLDSLVGQGRAAVSLDVPNYIMTITTSIDDAPLFREVEHTIRIMKPANIIYRQNTALNDGITLEEHISKKSITWNYRLDGDWQLGDKPFASYGAEVPIT